MRDLSENEKILLENKNYIPYSQVKKASNGREYILVKDQNGKKLGARFLSFFNNMKKKEEPIKNINNNNLLGGNNNNNMLGGDNNNMSYGNNNNMLGGDNESMAIDKLSEISQLHDTIMKLQKDIERLETKYNSNISIDKKNPLEKNIHEKKITLDNVSIQFEKQINENKSILPDKNTILDIINDIL